MIWRAPMGTIRRPLDSGDNGTEATDFKQCVDGQEPLINELWCLGLEGISRKVHPTERVEVAAETAGEFVTDCLAENGRRIEIIGKLSVNNSVQFWDMNDQGGGSGMPFIFNLLAYIDSTGWGGSNYSDQDWGGRFNDFYRMTYVSWGASIDPFPSYLLQSYVNPRAA